jgi:two-component system, LytTR family, sensor kinase
LGISYFLAIFEFMKRVGYQIIFWFFYWAINVYLDFYWVKDNIKGWDDNKIFFKTSIGAFLYILPLIALAYYLVFIAFEKIIQKKKSFILNAIIILIPYVIAICLSIVIVRLIVFPFIYENTLQPGKLFFEPRRFLSIMIEAAFPAGLLMSFKYVDIQLASKEWEKNLIKEKLSTELQFLKNQLNPHFLFNTLNNIYALSRKQSVKTPEVVMKLSELLSFMLYESDKETIFIEREIKFLEDYISLEKIRYTEGLSVVFTKEIDNPLQQIAPLLLLPLVENAFKHGASENHFDSFIYINLMLKEQQLSFTVENSFEESLEDNKSNNIGLHNTTRQLELIYKEQKLEINKTANIFKVQLEVNLNSYGKI